MSELDLKELEGLVEGARKELAEAATAEEVRRWRARHLAKKAPLQKAGKVLGNLPRAERAKAGAALNRLRGELEEAVAEREGQLKEEEARRYEERHRLDATLPGLTVPPGGRHPVSQVQRRICDILFGMGFQEATGPEVEDDEHAFSRLNIPPDHPARDMWDTFWLKDGRLLRPHTSPVQIRAMEKTRPRPLKIISPGRVFRYEDVTARSECQFHQVEGLDVDYSVTLRDLLATLLLLARRLFGRERRIRVRNSYFPFTEPSIEVDVDCFKCEGAGCNICKKTGWIEILGAGMVNPRVLEGCGYDPKVFSGYAFGLGVERIAMLLFEIDDIRHFFRNDARFLSQFRRVDLSLDR